MLRGVGGVGYWRWYVGIEEAVFFPKEGVATADRVAVVLCEGGPYFEVDFLDAVAVVDSEQTDFVCAVGVENPARL